MGKIIAYAGMLEDKQVTWFPSYGAEVRGGTANCTVVISDELIGSPVVTHPDILIVMSDASLDKFLSKLKHNGLFLYDSSLIRNSVGRRDIEVVDVPATEIASKIGSTKSANMVLLGALIAETDLLKIDSVLEAVENSISDKKKIIDINKKAIIKGIEYIENKKGQNFRSETNS